MVVNGIYNSEGSYILRKIAIDSISALRDIIVVGLSLLDPTSEPGPLLLLVEIGALLYRDGMGLRAAMELLQRPVTVSHYSDYKLTE